MNPRALELVDEISQIREQYTAEVGPGGRRVWPKAIKERIIELRGLGIKTREIARLTEIPVETLYAWQCQRRKQGFKALPVVQQRQKTCATVTVTNLTGQSPLHATVTVKTPKGLIIEGLTLEAAIELAMRVG